MKIQLNHPGRQKKFKLGNGYIKVNNHIIRVWNSGDIHYRKFIKNKGYFVSEPNDIKPNQADLYFWGEWEGNSFFYPYPKTDSKIFPNGLHIPFHSTTIRGLQNTDPYIYGEDFKYCVCKQRGQLCTLILNDLILFGTTVPSIKKFYIDTVFVVKDNETSSNIQANKALNYTQIYREQTLEQLNEYLKEETLKNNNKVYHSKTWWNSNTYFSFVPCKTKLEAAGFERFYLNLNNGDFQLSSNPTGISFLKRCSLSSKELWIKIVEQAMDQGFKLGIRFEEPKLNELLNHIND